MGDEARRGRTTEEIATRWAAAVPGPWRDWEDEYGTLHIAFVPDDDGKTPLPEAYPAYSCGVSFPGDMEVYEGADLATAAAIAAAPEDVAALLAEVAALRAVVRDLTAPAWAGYVPDYGEAHQCCAYCEAAAPTTDLRPPAHAPACPLTVARDLLAGAAGGA